MHLPPKCDDVSICISACTLEFAMEGEAYFEYLNSQSFDRLPPGKSLVR